MTKEEAWRRTKGYLYDALDGDEACEIIEALEQSLCEDCISREEAVTEINKYHMTSGVTHQCVWNECVGVIAKTIQELPSVTPQEPKIGRWIKSNIGGAKVCSVCKKYMGLSSFKYCPNCGASMEEESEEE